MAAPYILTSSNNIIQRTTDGAFIPTDPRNVDYQGYLTWVAANNTPDPYVPPPAPTPVCLLWQLQAVLTPAQWTAVQTYITSTANNALIAFASHGSSPIPANSTTLLTLAGVAGIDPTTLPALITTASQISIP